MHYQLVTRDDAGALVEHAMFSLEPFDMTIYPLSGDNVVLQIKAVVQMTLDVPRDGQIYATQPLFYWSPSENSPEYVKVELTRDPQGQYVLDFYHYNTPQNVTTTQTPVVGWDFEKGPLEFTFMVRGDRMYVNIEDVAVGWLDFDPVNTGLGYFKLFYPYFPNLQAADSIKLYKVHIDRFVIEP